MSSELFLEDEIIDDELEQVWIVAEALSRDIVEQLADLHTLKGAAFISMLKEITQNSAFSLLEWRQEPQASSPILTLIVVSLQSWDRRVRLCLF